MFDGVLDHRGNGVLPAGLLDAERACGEPDEYRCGSNVEPIQVVAVGARSTQLVGVAGDAFVLGGQGDGSEAEEADEVGPFFEWRAKSEVVEVEHTGDTSVLGDDLAFVEVTVNRLERDVG